MTYRFGTLALLLLLGLVADTPSGAVAAVHPSVIPSRARGGEVYREALRRNGQRPAAAEGAQPQPRDPREPPTNYYEQRVDHADAAAGTFRQRWWVERSFWDRDAGPAVLYVNGEGPASPSPGGFVRRFGFFVGAIIFSLEHRYYGESLPAPLTNRSMLKHLTVENALADLRAFKRYAEEAVVGKKLKWLVVGGSYAGALSAWARATYPEDFHAAWSSSGVVNAIFDYSAFDGHLLDVLPSACAATVRAVFDAFSEAYDDPQRRGPMMQTFGTPGYFTKADMAWMLADGSAMAVQYGFKDMLCAWMEPVQGRELFKRYADLIRLLWGDDFTRACYYSSECLSNAAYSDQWNSSYAWAYQCCSQLAYWQVGYPGSLRLREITTSYFIDQCRAAFGEEVFPDTYAFNAVHGGAHPTATRVVATQGSDDPWLPAGVTHTLSAEYPEVTAQCNGCGHCGDLGSFDESEPPSLTAQRLLVANYLSAWLGN
ncbi:putative serine carboxypeptidase S28 [Trypanosoma conorhini]|uniref:Putative serine carboxypeptidase S28 n=1 Tax=Trypanosoma conorhini TaxID=83891 RepID=A0A422PYU1_9TRYP|nr:putative serine carboxypeptidase S28 [Trypanosoma conorhini]RNF22911.1 putative serine carboxypeptidase S28 [Trypanosoma conorhini]